MLYQYALVECKQKLDTKPGTTHGSSDIIFDWTPIEIPTGACSIKTIHGSVEGTDGAAGNTHDIHLYVARSINGGAPPTFGTENGVNAKATTVVYKR